MGHIVFSIPEVGYLSVHTSKFEHIRKTSITKEYYSKKAIIVQVWLNGRIVEDSIFKFELA